MIRALVFDLGNVLVCYDNAILWRSVAALTRGRSTAEDVHHAIFETDFNHLVNRGHLSPQQTYEHLSAALGIEAGYDQFARAWNGLFWAQVGIERLLDPVQGRYRLVVLSNINPIHAAHVRATTPLLEPLDALMFSCEAGIAKPEPDMYAEAARRAGAKPQQCLFTDDIAEYVDAARGAEMQAFQFTTIADAEQRLAALGVIEHAP